MDLNDGKPGAAPIPDLNEARPLAVHDIVPKTVLNRMRPFRQADKPEEAVTWSINPYRGCQHACAYCYARRTHVAFDLDGGRDFEQEIFVKAGAADVLRQQLRRRRSATWDAPIVIGTAVDPYQPIEGQRGITRALLQVLCEARAPITIITKNTMVVRDIDLLAEIARRNYCAVFISITTMDATLARRMEPATPPPQKRMAAIQRLVAKGIAAGVMLAPILPGITDGVSMLEDVITHAHQANAQWLSSGVLRLHPDVRPWFFGWLQQEYPALLPRYEEWYRYTEAPRAYHTCVHERVAAAQNALGLASGPPVYENRQPRQAAMF